MSRDEKVLICIILLCIIVVGYILRDYKWDDQYIIYRYAENIANGNGWVFNPGEAINGCTSVLYPLLLAGLGKMGMNIPVAGLVTYLLFLGLVAFYAYRLLKRHGFPIGADLIPVLILLHPIFIYHTGMETTLFLFLSLLSIYYYFEDRIILTSVLLSLSVLSRPDTILLAIILFFHYVFTRKKMPYLSVILFVVPFIPWLVYSKIQFGSFFPATLSAKMSQGGTKVFYEPLYSKVFDRVINSMPTINVEPVLLREITIWIYLGLLLFGLLRLLFSRKEAPEEKQKFEFLNILLIWGTLHFAGYVLLNIPRSYRWHWAPLALIYLILGVISLELIYLFFKPRMKFVGVLVTGLLFGTVLFCEYKMISDSYIESYQKAAPRPHFYIRAAKWLKENTPMDARVGVSEIGVLGYFSERRLIDAVGLVTPGVAQHRAMGDDSWFIRYYKPEYLVRYTPYFPAVDVPLENYWWEKAYGTIKTVTIPDNPGTVMIYKMVDEASIPELEMVHTPLMVAVEQNQAGELAGLLKSTTDINKRDLKGNTALIYAVLSGQTETAKRLVEAGAKIDMQNEYGATPLFIASTTNNKELTKYLLEQGADPDMQFIDGGTPLIYASKMGYLDIVNLLLEHHVYPNMRNNDGGTAIMDAAANGYKSIVETLINNNADINTQTKIGWSALLAAAYGRRPEIVRVLLERGADPNVYDKQKNSALMIASLGGDNEIAQILLEHGADIHLRNKGGGTPLMAAAWQNHKETVELLKKYGAKE